MSKTELLNPIAKYYIIDSQFGYKQNVSLEQNLIQKLEKLFSRAETTTVCPASGAGEDGLLSHPSPYPPALSAHPCTRQPLVCTVSSRWDTFERLLVVS